MRHLFILLLLLTTSSWASESVTLQLKWYHQFQFAGYYVAKELGFYQQAGLDVTILPGRPGLIPTDEILSNRAQFAVDNSGLLTRRAEGNPIKVLAAIFQHDSIRLITRADAGIQAVEDLANKNVMLEKGYGSMAILALLDKFNLTDKIRRQISSHNINDLIEGRTDAFNGYISNEPFFLEERNIPFNTIDPADHGIEFYSDILFTSEQLTRENPELVVNFTKASLRGWEYAMSHVDEAIQITRQYAPKKSVNHLRYEAISMQSLIMPELIAVGHMNPLRWQHIQQQLLAIGMIKQPIDVKDLIFDIHSYSQGWRSYLPYIAIGSLALLIIISLMVYSMLQNKYLSKKVESSQAKLSRAYHAASHDALTGLPNRLLLMERLNQKLARIGRSGESPLLGFIDLDNFKLVNDQFGHDRGDKLLQAIAEQVCDVIRPNDTFARLSGDEFVLLADDTHSSETREIGERLMQAVAEAGRKTGLPFTMTASIGLLLIKSDQNIDAAQALKLADKAMYKIKNARKNDITVHEFNGHPNDSLPNSP